MPLSLKSGQHIDCPHFELCSGCSVNKFIESLPVIDLSRDYFKKRGIPDFRLFSGQPWGWRYRAKLAVQGASKSPCIGLYQEGTHKVVDIPLCRVHHPQINRAIEKIRMWIKSENLILYDEKHHLGDLRYLQLVVERNTGKVQLSCVLNAKNHQEVGFKKWISALDKLWNESKEGFWHSFWLNFNPQRTNVIFGPHWEHLKGEPLLWERFGKVEVCFQPASFAQANLDLFESMLASIQNKITRGAILCEIYAGVGGMGLFLAENCQKVLCCESNPFAEFCFIQSKERLAADIKQKISYQVEQASQSADRLDGFDTVLVDPPRKGLDPLLLQKLQQTQTISKLLYVSCGWSSFERDSDALLEAGWQLTSAEGYLFFPGSNHIEVLAQFSR